MGQAEKEKVKEKNEAYAARLLATVVVGQAYILSWPEKDERSKIRVYCSVKTERAIGFVHAMYVGPPGTIIRVQHGDVKVKGEAFQFAVGALRENVPESFWEMRSFKVTLDELTPEDDMERMRIFRRDVEVDLLALLTPG